MSGNAALAAARRRRVNNQDINNNNIYQQEILDNNEGKQKKMSLGQAVFMHENKLEFLKNQLERLKSDKSLDNNSVYNNTIDQKLISIEKNNLSINHNLDKLTNEFNEFKEIKENNISYNEKLSKLNNEFEEVKKNVENFKLIFLNINKIVNELKISCDSNTNEIENIKNFLKENEKENEQENVAIEIEEKN